MYNNSYMIKRFFIYGLTGWGMEIVWTGLYSMINGDIRLLGSTSMWMLLIYGCGVFLEPIHDIIGSWWWFFRGVIWVTIIWGIEYTSGLILLKILGICPWVYTDQYAVDGLITLKYAPAWFVAGLFFERLHHTLDIYGVA